MDVTRFDWNAAGVALDAQGWTILPRLLDDRDCREAAAWWEESRFRSRVTMARHGFGSGEYRYFGYPLPEPVVRLRDSLYPPLAEVANRWRSALAGGTAPYPPAHVDYLDRCRAAGQSRPTPLLLRYGTGDHNCLHQDLYGAEAFPLQVAILLSRPGEDFTGGEFLLAEQRPRRQSRATVVPLEQGDAVAFAVSERPVRGSRGFHRARMKHGVSTVRSGGRFTLGVIFHDAE
jgi:hypothetical protein